MQAINTNSTQTTGLTPAAITTRPNCRTQCPGTCGRAKNSAVAMGLAAIPPTCVAVKKLAAINQLLRETLAQA